MIASESVGPESVESELVGPESVASKLLEAQLLRPVQPVHSKYRNQPL